MTLRVDFDMNFGARNDAFQEEPRREIARILMVLANKLRNGDDDEEEGSLFDLNGGRIGAYALRIEEDEDDDRRPQGYKPSTVVWFKLRTAPGWRLARVLQTTDTGYVVQWFRERQFSRSQYRFGFAAVVESKPYKQGETP